MGMLLCFMDVCRRRSGLYEDVSCLIETALGKSVKERWRKDLKEEACERCDQFCEGLFMVKFNTCVWG